MAVIHIEKLDEVFVRVYSEPSTEKELCDFFTYEFPGAKFTPQYKARLWDGKVRMYDPIRKSLYLGLVSYVERFASENGDTVEYVTPVLEKTLVTQEEITAFASKLNPHSRGEPIEIRDYQLEAVHTALERSRVLLLSPTASGKSFIIYLTMMWHLSKKRKCIIIVPTTSLVEQLQSDFREYSAVNGFDVDKHCQKLYSGFSKVISSSVLITTWQSIYLQPKSWFAQFDVIFGDEAHQFKAKSLTTVMEKMSDVKYRIGTTGTLDNKKVHQLVLEGIFGPIHRVTTTKKLMDQGSLTQLAITCVVLKYPEAIRKEMNKSDYQTELNYVVTNHKRNRYITDLTLKFEGNSLVLFQFVEKHGKILHQMIEEGVEHGRKVFFVHGGTDTSRREEIRALCAKETNAIIVASFGTFSTGINIPSIENIVFASPSKGKIRNLQSIGRGLRLNNGKTICNLYDIADDLQWKKSVNHTLKHAAERYKIYAEEQFNVKLLGVNLE